MTERNRATPLSGDTPGHHAPTNKHRISSRAPAATKALLDGEIIKMLDREGLTVRAAQVQTGTAAADFSRIRKA